MAKEYIEREKAIGIMCDGCNIEFSDEPCEPNDCRLYRGIREMPAADVYPREQIAQEIFNDLMKKMTFKRESIGDFYEIASITLEEIARKYTEKK